MKRKSLFIVTFITASLFCLSAAATGQDFCFVVIADTQGDSNGVSADTLDEMVQATIAEGAAFIIVAGDLVDGIDAPSQGTFEQQLLAWRQIMQPLYDAGIGVYPVRGNHDNGAKAVWDSVFSGSYALPGNGPAGEENVTFSFSYENTLIIGLDIYTNPHRINQPWLDGQLASNNLPHIFTFGHEPAFKIFHSDCLDDYPSERDTFWQSLAAAGSRVYFCGHDHSYNNLRIDDSDGNFNNDVHQIIPISGNKSYPEGLYDGNNGNYRPRRIDQETSQRGYILVEIDGNDATVTWKRLVAPGVFEVGDIFSYSTEAIDAPAVEFADDNLKAAVELQLGLTEPNTTDILTLSFLDANDMTITDLSGLQLAKNLTHLHLTNNTITDIYPLTSLANLSRVELEDNPLDRSAYCAYLPMISGNNPAATLTFNPNPAPGDDCEVLFADPNLELKVEAELAAADPNFYDMLNLTKLNALFAGISNLNGLQYAHNLARLNLSANQISDISFVSKLRNLTTVYLIGNQISEIAVISGLKNVTWLDLYSNDVSDISAISQLYLTKLRLGDNPLDTAAYCTFIPELSSRNTAIDISFDANPNPLTADCSTTIEELRQFTTQWLQSGCDSNNNWCLGADLNHLEGSNMKDFAEFAKYWLK